MIGENVLVAIPTLKNRRRAIITDVNTFEGTMTVKLSSNGQFYQITPDQIKASKSTVETAVANSNPDEPSPNLNISTATSISMRQTRRQSSIKNNENIRSPYIVPSETDEFPPVVFQKNKRALVRPFSPKKNKVIENNSKPSVATVRPVLFNILKIIHFIFFSVFSASILAICQQREVMMANVTVETAVNTVASYFVLQRPTFLWFFTFLTLHATLYYASYLIKFPKFIITYVSPLFIGLILFLLAHYKSEYISDAFNNTPSLFASYFYLTLILTVISLVFYHSALFDHTAKIFLHQHSSLLTFIIFLHHCMFHTAKDNDHQQFYLFCISCYIVLRLIRIESNENLSRPNFVHLFLTSPFLLTIPAFKVLEVTNNKWPMICYMPIFMNLALPFLWLIENKFSNQEVTPKTRFLALFFYSTLKMSVALICGLNTNSIVVWSAVIGDSFCFITF